eukprot:3526232-Amphidinium_carterae.2
MCYSAIVSDEHCAMEQHWASTFTNVPLVDEETWRQSWPAYLSLAPRIPWPAITLDETLMRK